MKIFQLICATPVTTCYANDNDALLPELWAQESLAVLEENMVAGMLVYRDFEDEVANFGDTVNTRKPASFTGKRKDSTDNVTIQDASSTNIPVVLNQHVHTSFLIRDGEESMAFKSLVEFYLAPAMTAQAKFVDQVVLGQYPQFLGNSYGQLGAITSSNAKDYILGVRNAMNKNNAYVKGRNLVWTPDGETAALGTEIFLTADKVGDDGTALREASMGRKLGFDHYMDQNASAPTDADLNATDAVGAINNSGGYAAGSTALTVDGFTAAIANNRWIKLGGVPYRVVSTTGGSTPTAITVTPALRDAVADDAVITVYAGGAVNNASGYAAGYKKYIAVDGFTKAPRVGQAVTFGTDSTSAVYTIIQYDSSNGILLDRPLAAALVDDANVNLAPGGQYNFAFHRNAVALVVRPLATPRAGAGALSAVVNYNGLSMRAVITYDGEKQGHLVTLDMLMGVKVLDTALGAVLLG